MPSDVIGQINGEDTQDRFQDWVLRQDKVWVDRKGNVRLIERMDSDYLLNVLQFLLWKHTRRLREASLQLDPRERRVENVPIIQALRAELLARMEKPAKELRYRRILVVSEATPSHAAGSPSQWQEADLVLSTSGRVLKDRWGAPEPTVEVVKPPTAPRRRVTSDPIGIESALRNAKDAGNRHRDARADQAWCPAGEERAVVIDYTDTSGRPERRAALVPWFADEKVGFHDLMTGQGRTVKFENIRQVEGPMSVADARLAVARRTAELPGERLAGLIDGLFVRPPVRGPR